MKTRSITFRRIGAVLGGLLTIFVVTTAIDIALHVTGIFPPLGERLSDPLFVLATAYRIAIAVAGCYLARGSHRIVRCNTRWCSARSASS